MTLLHAVRSERPVEPEYLSLDSSDEDLLEDPTTQRSRLLKLYGAALPFVMAGYLAFDRAFAYLHVPGTPLYVAEVLLAIGVLGVLGTTGPVRRVWARDPLLMVLAGFMLWGAVRTVPGLRHFGVAAVRDAALWYYGLFALLVVAAAAQKNHLIPRLVRMFSRFVPWLLVWLPFALVLPRVKSIPIRVPGSPINILSHRPGNVAVVALIGLAFLQLVPDPARSTKARTGWSLLALGTIALAGTQSRGGFGAVCVAIVVALMAGFVPNAGRLMSKVVVLALLVIALTLTLSVSVSVVGKRAGTAGEGRTLSASQLVQNITSVAGVHTSGNQRQTVRFRDQLWSRIFDKQVSEGRLIHGFGFGTNLAAVAGVGKQAFKTNLELRSPHNSHLDVLARMGLVGLGLWVILWVGWFRRLLRARRRAAADGDSFAAGVMAWCVVSATAILVAAGFDPTLEGAQIAGLLWTLFGVGVWLSRPSRRPQALRFDTRG